MAIWEAHGRKCVYEGIPINWDAVQIDHILPQSLWSDVTEKRRVFELMGLSEDFAPNDLENLLPCRALRNLQKSDWIFDPKAAHFYRQLAKEIKAKVQGWIEKLSEEAEQDRIRSSAEAACELNPIVKQKLLAALATTEPYPTENEEDTDRVRFSRSHVLLNCNLPKGEDYGSLLININTLYLHRVQITLDAQRILETVLRGWGTSFEVKQRGFVIGPRTDAPGEWIVQLGSVTIFLTTGELGQLCDVVDLLAPSYLQALLVRERAEGTLWYAPDGPRNVRLLTLKRALWAEIMRFASEHDYADGNTAWHIFDAQGNGHIKMVKRKADGAIVPFCAYIYCTIDESDAIGPMINPADDVCLCWDWDMSRLYQKNDDDGRRLGWTAEATQLWLAEELIPEVLRSLPVSQRGLLERFRDTFFPGTDPRYCCIPGEGAPREAFATLDRWSALTGFLEAAQIHYNSHPHDPVWPGSMQQVLAALVLVFDGLPVDLSHSGYYSEKLWVDDATDLSTVICAARRRVAAINAFRGFDLDCALRCLYGALRDHAPADSRQPELLSRVVDALSVFPQTFQQDVIRHRTLTRLEHHSTWR